MSFDQLVQKNASIMDAYKAMMTPQVLSESKKEDEKQDLEKVEDELEKVADKIDEGIEHDDPEFGSWMDSVKAKHAGKDLKFKNRIEKGTHTTSAEVSGEDRSYGVWDHSDRKGHVFEEAVELKEEKVIKNISVWSHAEPHGWGHYSDYDDINDAKEDRDYLKRQGEKKVKIIKTSKEMSDWRNSEHRDAAIKMLSEACSEDDADDSSIKKVEEADRSEFNANKSLEMSTGYSSKKDRTKGKFYLMNGDKQVHPDAHDSVDSALQAWKTLDSTSGVKIVKEDVDGPVDVVTEELIESFINVLTEGRYTVNSKTGEKLHPKTGEVIAPKEKPLTVSDMFADKPAVEIKKPTGRDIDNAIGETYPDVEPYEALAKKFPELHKKGNLIDHLDAASKADGFNDFNDHVDSVHKQYAQDNLHEQAIEPNFVGKFNGVVSNYRSAGRQYDTVSFSTIKDANDFMSSEHGTTHGYLGQCPDGKYHCADMSHEGSVE